MGRIRRGVWHVRHEEDWLDLAEHWPVGALQCVGGLEVVAGVGLVQTQAGHLVPRRQHEAPAPLPPRLAVVLVGVDVEPARPRPVRGAGRVEGCRGVGLGGRQLGVAGCRKSEEGLAGTDGLE